ncbi:hypothetical protein [Falsirhodobacter sp. 20TX0035]|nr:hypothetical protein [Falsirhodobacter sp. 20TX0035]MDB6453326.1 hypothetical protein [Falsirhodobacter sp. 20TX0035]
MTSQQHQEILRQAERDRVAFLRTQGDRFFAVIREVFAAKGDAKTA